MNDFSTLGGLRVLVTGQTGFKGGWLSLWLHRLGAEVYGIGLQPSARPNLFDAVGLDVTISSRIVDIRDAAALREAVCAIQPQLVFHLAAQPLVRQSYRDPLDTFATNVMGTAHLLDACRQLQGLRAVICVTTDKVYENREWPWPYRESDRLGGKDPYSASKASAELVCQCYRRSYFDPRQVPVLTARGGNVIGGGDFSADRLLPDIVRARAAGATLSIRSPEAVRPWQHVLALCHGYLRLAEAALSAQIAPDGAWNFGPSPDDFASVRELVQRCAQAGFAPAVELATRPNPAEAMLLTLDSSKAHQVLGWRPALALDEAIAWTLDWYLAAERGESMGEKTMQQIATYAARLQGAGGAC